MVLHTWVIYLLSLATLNCVKKMASYTTDQKVFFFVTKTLYSSGGGSCVAVEESSVGSFLSSRATTYRIIKQFEETRNMRDERAKGREGSESVRTEEFVSARRETITRSPRKVCDV
jgi:hypothetical protein